MSQLKEDFKELLKKIRTTTRDSYADISHKTGIKLSVLKNAGSPTDRSFNIRQIDYDVLHETYFSKKKEPKNEISESLAEIKDMVKKQSDFIMNRYSNIIDPVVKEISEKYNRSEKDIIEALKIVLLEKLNQLDQEQQNEQKKSS